MTDDDCSRCERGGRKLDVDRVFFKYYVHTTAVPIPTFDVALLKIAIVCLDDIHEVVSILVASIRGFLKPVKIIFRT